MDALSDVLRAVRLTGAVFFDVHASDPWVAETPPAETIVKRLFPHAEHLICYHAVIAGGCWASLDDESPVRLAAGDVIVFPHGDPHAMSSAPGLRRPPRLEMYRRSAEQQLPFTITLGETRVESGRFVCGFLGCDATPFNPLLSALPRAIHISEPVGGAIRALVEFALAEAQDHRPGSQCVLGHLSELMFVDVVRRYVEGLPADRTGWLAGLREPFVGRALEALHREPGRAWTLEALSRDVGLSRSALAERFTQFVGQPPMQYLTNWRMQLASSSLLSGTESVAAVAETVGYESEAAFSRAFKKVVGVPPSQWRRARAGEPRAAAAAVPSIGA
jgi:AraC-like DNA-binding protein